jgi:DNA recombination protein RmuC
MEIILIVLAVLILIGVVAILLKPAARAAEFVQDDTAVLGGIQAVGQQVQYGQADLKSEFKTEIGQNRLEVSAALNQNREELGKSLALNRGELANVAKVTGENFAALQAQNEKKLDGIQRVVDEKLQLTLRQLSEDLARSLENVNKKLDEKLGSVERQFETKFTSMQVSNEKRLEQIQFIVDEKLQETLNKRINESFKQVTDNLTRVQEGLGEMKTLANDVGSLSRVLGDVKTRGITGEVQLGRILEQMFAPNQYIEQFNIKGSNAVDYAIVLPGKADGEFVYLPIDAKFPGANYERVVSAEDKEQLNAARKALFADIKREAKSMNEKYIEPPKTTDFAIMFLPTEGLYMEVVNDVELYESLQRDYKVNIAGPTTMTAILNSLQMGFKTLQIERKSSEVFEVLGAVKNEFGKFRTSLGKVHKKIQESEREIETLITTRTNMMDRSLKSIDSLDAPEDEITGIE